MNRSKNTHVLFLAQAAMIAAVYAVLTLVFAPVSYGEVQVRISEALTILPLFTPAAVPGLFLGCLLSNLLGGCILIDILLGSLATLLGAAGTRALRHHSKYLAPVPPVISNMLIVPFVLRFGYQLPLPVPFLMLTVGLGQFISCGVLGLLLYSVLDKYRYTIFKSL